MSKEAIFTCKPQFKYIFLNTHSKFFVGVSGGPTSWKWVTFKMLKILTPLIKFLNIALAPQCNQAKVNLRACEVVWITFFSNSSSGLGNVSAHQEKFLRWSLLSVRDEIYTYFVYFVQK